MSEVVVERYDDFTGGLNLRADQFKLARNESPEMLNIEVDPRGGMFTRGAMRAINSTAIGGSWDPVRLYPLNGETPRLMLSTLTRAYWSSGTNFTMLEYGAGTPVVASSPHGFCMVQWNKKMYMTTGSAGNGGYEWDPVNTYATALTASGASPNAWQATPDPSAHKMPTAEHIAIHANKMFVANTTEATVHYPNRVRYSLEAIPDNWHQDHYFDFEGGGEGVTAIASTNGQLLVFKPGAIYVVFGYDADDFQIVQLTNQLGVLEHEHVAVAENGVYFYSHQKGLYFYDGTRIVDVSEQIRPIFPEGYVNVALPEKFFVSYINGRVWLSAPYSKVTTANETTASFVFDPTINDGCWVVHSTSDGHGIVGGTDWTDSTGRKRYFGCHPTLPRVLEVDLYEYEKDVMATTETGFPSFYRTGWYDGRMYSMKKMFRRPDFVVKQLNEASQINVKVYHNYEEAPGNERKNFNVVIPASAQGMRWGLANWGSGYWGLDAEGSQVIRGSNLGLARSVQLLFTGPSGLAWGIDSIAYKFNTRKVSG